VLNKIGSVDELGWPAIVSAFEVYEFWGPERKQPDVELACGKPFACDYLAQPPITPAAPAQPDTTGGHTDPSSGSLPVERCNAEASLQLHWKSPDRFGSGLPAERQG